MPLPLPLAFSFPAWICRGCGQRVEWIDAAVIDEPDVFAVVHKTCPVLGVFHEATKP